MSTLLDDIVDRDVPFFGACYGVGTLGVHQGAVIDGTYAEPIGAVTVTLTDEGRADPLLATLPDSFAAFVGHKEACRVLPADAVLLASSPTCPVQMFRVRQNLYATQFHPELDLAGITTRIGVYRDYGYYQPGEYDEVIDRVRSADVWAPPRILEAFVRRYARAAGGVTAGIVSATHDGAANFAISVLDAENGSTGELLVNTIGSYSGTTLFGQGLSEPATLQVSADGAWSLTIAPMSAAPLLAPTGSGDAVVLYDGPTGALTATHDGDGNFAVSEDTGSVLEFGLLINEIGPYSGTVPLSAGPSVVSIKANGGWTMTVG